MSYADCSEVTKRNDGKPVGPIHFATRVSPSHLGVTRHLRCGTFWCKHSVKCWVLQLTEGVQIFAAMSCL